MDVSKQSNYLDCHEISNVLQHSRKIRYTLLRLKANINLKTKACVNGTYLKPWHESDFGWLYYLGRLQILNRI